MHQKNLLKKALLRGKEAANPAAQKQARVWTFMGEKGRIFWFVAYSAQPRLYKNQECGLFSWAVLAIKRLKKRN